MFTQISTIQIFSIGFIWRLTLLIIISSGKVSWGGSEKNQLQIHGESFQVKSSFKAGVFANAWADPIGEYHIRLYQLADTHYSATLGFGSSHIRVEHLV